MGHQEWRERTGLALAAALLAGGVDPSVYSRRLVVVDLDSKCPPIAQ